MKKILKLPQGFVMGAATAATRIEGGNKVNTWYEWYKKGFVKDGDPSIAATHFKRFRTDIDLMSRLNIKSYRFSVEWARLQPRAGEWNECAFSDYREEIEYMLVRGIKPILTLHHFSNPLWFERLGGFEHPECVKIFKVYVEKVIKELGHLISEYITVNEPAVYATAGYLYGVWPSGKKSVKSFRTVLGNLAACHITAYNSIHTVRKNLGYTNTLVGVSDSIRIFSAFDLKIFKKRFLARLTDKYLNKALVRVFCLGKKSVFIKNRKEIKRGRYYDFIDANCDGVRLSDNEFVKVIKSRYTAFDTAVYLTAGGEGGKLDAERAMFVYNRLRQSVQCELVKRFYYGAFTDSFDWLQGFGRRMGLVKVDFKTQKRTIRPCGRFYANIISNNGVTEAAYLKYVLGKKL